MSYLALCAAPFDNNEIQQPINSEKKRNGKNKTLKKAIKEPMENKAKKVTSATISNLHEQPENTDTSMTNFTPPSHAKPSTMTEEDNDENEETETIDHSEPKPVDSPVSLEQFTTIESSQANDYFKQHVPYYTQMSEHPISSKDELLTKLDKILHLLQEHKDEQTGHVTEELVLYSFLGVFIIFIVDSFARAGKYMR
ncbi:MAG: hypothetical protein CMD14_09245 [Flavobacteriales bacterium]|nr:hypothetical protein [Flavobacteriales bacterium]|tara:strand:- start:1664 stop:2254 length:591 start_codon:yes stop_codon:yes gene_type:complete